MEIQTEYTNTITALSQFSILKISGKDSNQFLQGQLTCNVNELSDSNSFFAAFCNAKGRTITTLLILKSNDDFLLILPTVLLDKVANKLKMYILRSDVQLQNMTDELCLTGVNEVDKGLLPELNTTAFSVTNTNATFITLPSNTCQRYLIISQIAVAKTLWTELTNASYTVDDNQNWDYADISSGLPWLSMETTEEYIPQMLNIDKLGGISFTKGCYTGQEIIARTHYLGKAKRELFLAECVSDIALDINTQIISNNPEQTLGKVLSLESNTYKTRLLLVLSTSDTDTEKLVLNNKNQTKINLIDFQ